MTKHPPHHPTLSAALNSGVVMTGLGEGRERPDDSILIARLDGLYVGMFDDEELEAFADFCRRSLMRRDYSHPVGGVLGLAKARAIHANIDAADTPAKADGGGRA